MGISFKTYSLFCGINLFMYEFLGASAFQSSSDEQENSELPLRIYHGDKSPVEYPFMVALDPDGGSHDYCSGALLDSQTVVTAAHCVVRFENGSQTAKFIFGAYNLTDTNNVRRGFTKCWIPDDYKPGKVKSVGDIAVCRLSEPVAFTKTIQRICVTTKTIGVADVTLIGFGIKDGEMGTTYLQRASGKTMTNKACKKHMPISKLQICAKLHNKAGKRAEQSHGDSGGPLFSMCGGDKYVLVGTVTYNYDYTMTSIPSFDYLGVYTRVSSFVEFLKKYANLDTDC